MHTRARILYLILIITMNVENVVCQGKTKIIGGSPVDIKHRPFMLSLHNSKGFTCGASILSRKWAITALHCLTLEPISNYYVRAGSNSPQKGGSLHRLTKMYAYNDTAYLYWLSSMLYHDIALFKVRPRFHFTDSVRAIRLPSEFNKPPRTLYTCGWGYRTLQNNVGVSNILIGVHVRYTPYETCINETPEYETIVKKETHLCYGAPGRDSCYGDSGGPLASKDTIYGIVSFGHNCGVVSGVYEKISYYRHWIKKITSL